VRAIADQVFRTLLSNPQGETTMKSDRIDTYRVDVATRLPARPPCRPRVRRLPIGLILLRHVGWVGLALFLTAGYAAGLNLHTEQSALAPGPLHACALFFAWCVILLGPSRNAGAESPL